MSANELTKLEQFAKIVETAEGLIQNAEANTDDASLLVRKLNDMLDSAHQLLSGVKNELAFASRNRLWSNTTSHTKINYFNDMVSRYKLVCQEVEVLQVSNKRNHSL